MKDAYNLFRELTLSKKAFYTLFNILWITAVATYIPIFDFPKLFRPFQLDAILFFQYINNNYQKLISATSIFLLMQFFISLLYLITFSKSNCFNRFLFELTEFTYSVLSYFVLSLQILKNIGVLYYSTIDFCETYILSISLNSFICMGMLWLNYATFTLLIIACFRTDDF